ncbi:MAG TPA: ATP-binding protein [Candidatus Aquilonibacter sp.]
MAPQKGPGRNNPGKLSLFVRIPPDARHARTVRDALIAFSSLHDVGEADLEALLFAVGEALANAIEHGAPAIDIDVKLEIDPELISARVTDYGTGFQEDNIPNGYTPLPDGLAERGRGIPIMQRYADRFEVESMPGHGTVVTLVRYRRNPAVHQEDGAIS